MAEAPTHVELSGKSLVIVGGSSGLGLAAAHAFTQAGAGIVIVGRNRANLERAAQQLGPRALPIAADARDPATAVRAIAQAVSAFDRFDGLYHAADGLWPRIGDGPLHEMTDETWRLAVNFHLEAVMYSNRAAIRQFLEQGSGGSILNLGSALGLAPTREHFVAHAYAAAKAAVVGLSVSLANAYAIHQIRVNVLAPGPIRQTLMAPRSAEEEKEMMRFLGKRQPLASPMGESSDLDAAAVYFMSDGSRFTTGQVLRIDRGWSVTA